MWGELGPGSNSCEEDAELRSAGRHGAEGSREGFQEAFTVRTVFEEIEPDISTSRIGRGWEPLRL